ncbi:hypothetical protein VM1G_07660 [Cytospora mali]|uniref:Uncharacterized protein n=1 Tax=Cytospora mali TaxID=578113 RepID=A0A194W818_CYTMA|nr:hypothetical protein VM1G_07660 [Valsa mali]
MDTRTKSADKRKAIIISGFTAIGKSSFSRNTELRRNTNLNVIDLDSCAYSNKPGFPENYLNDIRKAADKPCIILISTHVGLPTQLAKEGYYVALAYPGGGMDAKQAWLGRLEKREQGGRSSRLYKAMDEKWTVWFERTAKEQVTRKWTLSNDEYLSDIFGSIYADFASFKKRGRRQDGI